jgi:hypothetical protein
MAASRKTRAMAGSNGQTGYGNGGGNGADQPNGYQGGGHIPPAAYGAINIPKEGGGSSKISASADFSDPTGIANDAEYDAEMKKQGGGGRNVQGQFDRRYGTAMPQWVDPGEGPGAGGIDVMTGQPNIGYSGPAHNVTWSGNPYTGGPVM